MDRSVVVTRYMVTALHGVDAVGVSGVRRTHSRHFTNLGYPPIQA
jgi:hypothetical protein